jgi:hypothetical protein
MPPPNPLNNPPPRLWRLIHRLTRRHCVGVTPDLRSGGHQQPRRDHGKHHRDEDQRLKVRHAPHRAPPLCTNPHINLGRFAKLQISSQGAVARSPRLGALSTVPAHRLRRATIVGGPPSWDGHRQRSRIRLIVPPRHHQPRRQAPAAPPRHHRRTKSLSEKAIPPASIAPSPVLGTDRATITARTGAASRHRAITKSTRNASQLPLTALVQSASCQSQL